MGDRIIGLLQTEPILLDNPINAAISSPTDGTTGIGPRPTVPHRYNQINNHPFKEIGWAFLDSIKNLNREFLADLLIAVINVLLRSHFIHGGRLFRYPCLSYCLLGAKLLVFGELVQDFHVDWTICVAQKRGAARRDVIHAPSW